MFTVGGDCVVLWNCMCPPSVDIGAERVMFVLCSAFQLCVQISQDDQGMVVGNFLRSGCEVIPVGLSCLLVVFVVWCVCSNERRGFVCCGEVYF